MLTESRGKLEKSQGKVREKSGDYVSKIWQTPWLTQLQDPYISNCTAHKNKIDTYAGNYTKRGCKWEYYNTIVYCICGYIHTSVEDTNTEKFTKEMLDCTLDLLRNPPSTDENVCQFLA